MHNFSIGKLCSDSSLSSALSFSPMHKLLAYYVIKLLCSLLVRHECCSFSNGEYVKQGLAQLEAWCGEVKPEVILDMQLHHISKHEFFFYHFPWMHIVGTLFFLVGISPVKL